MRTDDRQSARLRSTGAQRNVSLYEERAMVDRYDELGSDGWLTDRESEVVEEYFTRSGRVLDVGCGTGRTTRPLAERGYDVIGIDVSEEMVEQARERHPDLPFSVGDATDLQFDDGVFDHVLFSYYGLDSIAPESQRVRAMAEIHRVLKAGGVFTFNSHNRWYVLPALLTDHGYVREYYLSNGNLDRLFSRYKRDSEELGLDIYRGSPRLTRTQLADAGFDTVEVLGKRDGVLSNFEIQHHYVARKS